MQIKTYDNNGSLIGKESITDLKKKPQDNLIYSLNRIKNLAKLSSGHTKTRGERRGGGAKPWRQKGTGRARFGSNRSPIWRKGGITFGPRKEKNYQRSTNKSSVKIAKNYLLNEKANQGEVIIWDIDPKEAPLKTKEAEKALLKLPLKEGRILMLIEENQSFPGFYNIGYLDIKNIKAMAALDPLKYKVIIITQKAFASLNEPARQRQDIRTSPNKKEKKNAKHKN